MIPEESEKIVAAGTVAFYNASTMIFVTGLFGAYILAFIISMHIILQKENNGRAHKALIALLLVGFAMVALVTCVNNAINLVLVKSAFMESLSGGLSEQAMAADSKTMVMFILQTWCENFILLIGDTATVWRAWALWTGNKLIKWMLLITLLAEIGIGIVDAIVDTKGDLNLIYNAVTLDWVSVVFNLLVNIVATLLIAYRAWTYHQSTHVLLCNKKTQVEAILLLMVESGAIFGVVQALNPVALVILIQTGNTYEHSFHLEDVPSLEFIQSQMPNLKKL
ncbi:hypothetical protein BT96DRAFT_974846 [Gymnopus androsaceus JB14]|uniref:Uncharacterized protein n=1 Tax=Gymnopus androsaceus JB14 TaxID=1447944 RepID=A0A6A4HSD3_9AGAR|nr:hypothetical protein BT96DRAFT_974846 [Gymnopus androsaceus JB14]